MHATKFEFLSIMVVLIQDIYSQGQLEYYREIILHDQWDREVKLEADT